MAYFIPKITTEKRNINLRANQNSFLFDINSSDANERLDKFLSINIPLYTRSHLRNLIDNGHVTVNNTVVKSGYKIKLNDKIAVVLPEPEPSYLTPENIALNIVYEDNDLLVINKPAGLVVHPGAGHRTGTMVNALLYHCKTLSGINGILRPGIVHRLDKNTSGLLVVAKNDLSHVHLSRQFEVRSIIRTYHAIVWGVPEKEGEISKNIGRSQRDRKKMSVLKDRGRTATTGYRLLRDYIYLSHLELSLRTGRTHQIRVHLNYINHPLFGDPDYNGRKSQIPRLPSHLQKRAMSLLKRIDRQALHAKTLEFIHPISSEAMHFDSELPEDMRQILDRIVDALMLG